MRVPSPSAGRLRRTASVGTAFVGEVADQSLHRWILGAADERGRLPLLAHQPRFDQPLAVMRQGGRRDPEPILNAANGQSLVACTHKDPIDVQARRVAERFELRCCLFELHGKSVAVGKMTVN